MMVRRWLWLVSMTAVLGAAVPPDAGNARASQGEEHWIGTWSTAAQPAIPGEAQTFRHQTIRLIVRASVGGKTLRVRLSNAYGDRPLTIDRARIARRTTAAHTEPTSDRALSFQGKASTTIAARATVVTDPVDLAVPALGELAVSLFFDQAAVATTSHALAQQTNYLSSGTGDFTAKPTFPVAETIDSWPFLTGIDVVAPPRGAAIVAFGSSTTDGDGSTKDANRRWPDILAERLQQHPGRSSELGVLNQGIIGNRLLFDSPSGADSPFGPLLGEAGVARFDRDVLGQPGCSLRHRRTRHQRHHLPGVPVHTACRTGDRRPPHRWLSPTHRAGTTRRRARHPDDARALRGPGIHRRRAQLTTFTPERERLRQEVNAWIRSTNEADAMVDFDAAVRDPSQPTRLLPAYDSGDHLHVNDAGNAAQAAAIPLTLFDAR